MKPTNFPNGIRGPLLNSTGAQPTAIVDLTDNTGGTGTDTLAAIAAGASYAKADMVAVKNAIASLSDKVTELNAALQAAQITAS